MTGLITWIDLNVPAYGTYHEILRIPSNFEKRRYESRKKYSLVDEDIEGRGEAFHLAL